MHHLFFLWFGVLSSSSVLVFTLSLAVTLQLEWQYQFQIKTCAVSDSSNCCWQNTSQTARPLARVSQGSVDPAKTPVLAFCAGRGGWEFTNEVMVTCWRLKARWSAPCRTKWSPPMHCYNSCSFSGEWLGALKLHNSQKWNKYSLQTKSQKLVYAS